MRIDKYLNFILQPVVMIMVMVVGISSCRKAQDPKTNSDQDRNLVSIVSIGKVVDPSDYDRVIITLKTNGQVQKFDGNSQLIKNILRPGQTVTVGASVSKEGKVLAQTIESSSSCPYLTRTLSAGVNHVSLVFCKIKQESEPSGPSEDDNKGETDNNKDKNKDKDKDVTKPTEPDSGVKDPNKQLNMEIQPDL